MKLFLDRRTYAAAYVALFYFLLMFIGAWFIGPSSVDAIMSINLGALGASVGWLLGVAASPYNKGEGDRFRNIISAVATFTSGYGLANLNHLLNTGLSVTLWDQIQHIDLYVWLRITAFIMSFFCSFLLTYATCVYELPKDLPTPSPIDSEHLSFQKKT
ncbi:hypothetical protein [Spirosoma flavum]|uniref:Uncharacterized protein n=1 Tax=Spirosoma flavum TaxID=2048557 RepID=A0ABW6AUX0_9BACT